ncbi:hypothetical protein EUAN_23770 [Andreesenia angusta]|uniref:Uncharacterized protein n=1 Tax=Andreesenia angusta TaxID=39480 RepID=A0A1S1V3M2_9FIRM|nr:hypothetical protein EUAN_23770 [Andreesenia angusta]
MLCGFLRPTACWCLERSHRPLPRPRSLAVAGEAACATRISRVRQCLLAASWGLFQSPFSNKTGLLCHSAEPSDPLRCGNAPPQKLRFVQLAFGHMLSVFGSSGAVLRTAPAIVSTFYTRTGLKLWRSFLHFRELEKARHPPDLNFLYMKFISDIIMTIK